MSRAIGLVMVWIRIPRGSLERVTEVYNIQRYNHGQVQAHSIAEVFDIEMSQPNMS